MASGTGRVTTVAARIQTGGFDDASEVAVGALDGILFDSESFSKTKEMLKDESISTPFIREIRGGNVSVDGSGTGNFRYENFDLWLTSVMGADAVTQPDVANAPAVFDRAITLVDDVLGNFLTFVADKIERIHVVPALKLTGFTISGDAGGMLKVEFTGIGNDRIYNSTTNEAAQITAVTYKTRGLTIPFNVGTFRLKGASLGALASPADKVAPNSFSLSIALPLEADAVACGGEQKQAPDYTGIPEVKLSLGFPRVLSALPSFVDFLQDETILKGDINYGGPIANPGEATELNHFWNVNMPAMKVMNAEELIEGVGKIPITAEFELLEVDVAPTGMTTTKPFDMQLRNTDARDFIA